MLSALSFGFIFHQLVHASKEFAPLFRGLVSHSICSLSSLSTAMDTLRSQSRRTYHEASSIDLTEHQHDLSQIKESQQLSEMFNIVDCQVQTAQNLKNQLVRSIMEKHLYAKEYPEKLEERIPLKELLTLVNKHLDDIVQKKHDTEKTVAKVMKEHHESTAELEQWIQQLNAEKAELQQAVDRIIEKDILFQKGFCPKRKNVCAADMATALKRHQDMEEHYRRMKNEIQGYSKTLLESTERIVKQLGQDISQNEARMQELLQKHIAETKKISQREAARSRT
ncbi:hypothetical protein BZA77DRAFT_352161 [Pyronema omphalodes]|nr:hypothetical protein BZA77DRAFT_296871 [Pyronema omphalodes]KAI5817973.1 hypothetical protein BZA77DRAFT_352161 [Pyronema omphalodes]